MGERLRYALHGAHKSRNEWWAPVAGGVLLAAAFYLVGQQMKLPAWIADNLILSGVALTVVCVFVAQAAIFVLRLAWSPVHERLLPYGGPSGALRAKLGVRMWPVILMASGMLAFVLMFGAGAIWALIQPEGLSRGSADGSYIGGTTHVADVGNKLRAIDTVRHYINADFNKARTALVMAVSKFQTDGSAERISKAWEALAHEHWRAPSIAYEVREYPGVHSIMENLPDREACGQAVQKLINSIEAHEQSAAIFANEAEAQCQIFGQWQGASDAKLLEMRKALSQ